MALLVVKERTGKVRTIPCATPETAYKQAEILARRDSVIHITVHTEIDGYAFVRVLKGD